MAEAAEWIEAARAATGWRPVPRPDEPLSSERPQPGELRAARPMDAGVSTPARLVLVLDVEPRECAATVALATDELDLATADDLLLAPEQTGAPFALVAQLGLQGPVWEVQLGPPVGAVDLQALEQDSARGLPLRLEHDPRRRFKESELEELRGLTSECMRALLREDESPPYLDPELFTCLAEEGGDQLGLLLGRRLAPLPVGSAQMVHLRVACAGLDPDRLEVAHSVLMESLNAGPSSPRPSPGKVSFSPERAVASEQDALDGVVTACLQEHRHSIRVITSVGLWSASSATVMVAETARGRVQLVPEALA